jgi:hypothetical protein
MRTIRDEDEEEEQVTIRDAVALGETDLALRVEIAGERRMWIPKSVITDDSEVFDAGEHGTGKLVLKGWFARKEGLAE